MTNAAPTSLQRLDRALGIHDGERLLVALLFAQYFCTGSATAFTQTAGFALFLGAFDARQLPFTYILMGGIISLLTLAYLQAGRFLSFPNQLKLNLVGQLVITAGFAIGLALVNGDWLVFGLPVLFQIAVVFGNMAFWSLAGRMLNVQQGKRLFGVVGTGEWLAIVVMGFLMPVLVPLVGLPNLLWLAVIGMGLALLVMTLNMRLHRHLVTSAPPPLSAVADPAPAPATGILSVLRSRYVLVLFALSMVWWVGFFFVDNIFYDQGALQFPDSNQLAGFLGLYLGFVGILTVLSNLLLAGRVVSRLGIRWSLLALPIGLVGGATIMAVTGLLNGPVLLVFGAAVATKVWSIGVGFSIDQSARSILVQPFSASQRTQAQTLIDGVAQPVSTAMAGALLLLLGALFPGSSVPLIYGLLAIAAVHLGIAVLVSRGYGKSLVDALRSRRLNSTQLVVTDGASRALLLEALRSEQTGAVVYAMRMLSELAPDALAAELPRLLERPESDIRRYALECLSAFRPPAALSLVHKAVAAETAPAVLGMGLRTLARLGDPSLALGHLAAGNPMLRQQAILAALESGVSIAGAAAETAFAELCAAPDASDRTLAAEILAEREDRSALLPRLSVLLADPEPRVRRAALRAAGQIRDSETWTAVIAALDDTTTRNAALSALVAGGPSAVAAMADTLRAGTASAAQVVCLARACGRIRAPAAIPVLLPLIDSADAAVRSSALRALRQCGYLAAPADMARLHASLRTEARHAAWLSAAAVDVGNDEPVALLETALAVQMQHSRERALQLLSCSTDASAIDRAARNLGSSDPRQRSYALEVLDIHIPVVLKPVVLPLLEDLAPAERLRRLQTQFPQAPQDRLARLAQLRGTAGGQIDSWTRATALYALGQLAPDELAGTREDDPASQLITPGRTNDTSNGEQQMLSTIEKVIMLRTAGIFAETTDEVLAAVAQIVTVEEVEPGTGILAKGDPGDSMFVVASGRVRVHDGSRALAELGPGEVFGEMALLDPEPRSASVTAIDETRLLKLDQEAFFELVEDRPEVARGLLRVLSRRLRQAN